MASSDLRRFLRATATAGLVIVSVSVAAGTFLAQRGETERAVASAQRPVQQSIQGLRSVLDPIGTGSIGRRSEPGR